MKRNVLTITSLTAGFIALLEFWMITDYWGYEIGIFARLLGIIAAILLAISALQIQSNHYYIAKILSFLSLLFIMLSTLNSFSVSNMFMYSHILSIILIVTSIVMLFRLKEEFQADKNPGIPMNNKRSNNLLNSNSSNGFHWELKLPGAQAQKLETSQLVELAKLGILKPSMQVIEQPSGIVYFAAQIPNVFSEKKYITALLLSFFFGVFGVDRFYLGHVGIGLGKLFTFGGLGIWALIDFILIATKNIKDNQGIPLA
jgi:TM2 domain-containing membrane protein YozV